MPRTRRTPAAETATEDLATPGSPPADPDTPSVADAQTTPDAPKAARRRGTRQPKNTPVEAAAPPETEAPAAEEAAKPARRRGRRTAAPEPAAETADMQTPPAESAEPSPARRRGRRSAAPPEPVAEAPNASVEAAPAEIPEREGAKRRRGRRAAAEVETTEKDPLAPNSGGTGEELGEESASPTPPLLGAGGQTSRRRGRNRQAVPEMATETALPEPIAQVAEGTPTEEAAPIRRRGRRKSAQAVLDTPPAPPSLELPDLEAPVADEEATEEATGDADDKRGRRSRRGRRRRGMDEPTTEMLEAAGSTLLVEEVTETETPEEEDDDTLVVYPPPAAPTFVAPPIVPPVLPPADESQAPRVMAAVQHKPVGLARIRVNDAEHLPYFFFVNADTAPDGETVEAQIREAAANGIHLFSGVMYLPLRNAYGDRSFGAIDALVQQILTADPDGFVLPRLQFFPTNFWARTHPDEMARFAGGEEGDVSLASTEFWADCVDALEALIAHFADPSTPGGDRILGFHLDRGEWFYDAAAGYDLSLPNQTAFQNWLRAKYQNLYALRAAWHDARVTWEDAGIPDWPGQTVAVKKTDTPLYAARREGRWPDYAQFASDLVADIISGLASAIKTLSQNRLIVAASYGYTLEFAGRNDSGHLALGKLLRSPDIDIVAGPNAYSGRGAGSPAAFPSPLDSVNLHGKLWLVEDDTKTFLAEAETDDAYNPKITSGADTQAIHQRHFGAALAHRAGVTWMDLWGQGWLNSPDIWRELGGLATQAARWEQVAPAQTPAPDVAVFVDEASLAYLKNDPNGLGTHLVSRTRDLLLRTGGSVGFYLQSDVTRPGFPDSKLYLFLNALRLTTSERQAIRERLQKPGKTLAWLYAPGVFDENGPSEEEVGEVVGMALRPQPWNSRGGSLALEIKHPLTERIRGVKKIGQEEIINPLYAVSDPQAATIAEYVSTGAVSLAAREHKSGWKSVFFGDPYLTTELLRGLYAYAGVALYDAQDDIVFAGGDGTLTVHGPFTGQRTLSLPRRASVYDVFDDKIIATNTRTFRAFVRARTTRLFLWGDGDALAAATGLDLPAQSAEAEPQTEPRPEPRVSTPPPLTPRRPASEISALPVVIPGLESSDDTLDTAEDDAADEDDPTSCEPAADGTEATEPSRRSRWQRRRAALRARKEAERAARLSEAAPDQSNAANPPLDMDALLPGLPPRRLPPPPRGGGRAGLRRRIGLCRSRRLAQHRRRARRRHPRFRHGR